MNPEQARAEFHSALKEFEAELAKSGGSDGKPEFPDEARTTLWSRLRSMGTAVLRMVSPSAAKMTMKAALQAVVGTHKILKRLADSTSNASELERYALAMRGLTAEYTALAEKVLDQSAAKYSPITQRFKAAAGELRASYQRAKQLASNLNLAADLLDAFAKLVSSF